MTIDVEGGDLRNSSGVDLTTGTVVLLVADTTGAGFSSFTTGSSLTGGSFLNSHDQILGSTNVLAGNSGVFMGSTSTSGSIQLMTGPYSADQLQRHSNNGA